MWAMWRNWVSGSRDFYLASSTDGGTTFQGAQKLGRGTWRLNACPMDGGGIADAGEGKLLSVWRREDHVYSARPGEAEVELGQGKDAALAGNGRGEAAIVWRAPSGLQTRIPGRSEPMSLAADGEYPSIAGTGPWFVAWEDKTGVVIQELKP